MKTAILLPIILCTGCVSHAPRKIVLTAAAPASSKISADALRLPEQIKEYRFGRYADPGDSLTMHESHPAYRVETSAGWSLNPGQGTNLAPPGAKTAAPSVAANDAVVAEVNKQRAATRAVTEQTSALNQHLGELSQAVVQTQEVAKENVSLKREMAQILERLDAVDEKIRSATPVATPPLQRPTGDKW